jgi:hypothetical protein
MRRRSSPRLWTRLTGWLFYNQLHLRHPNYPQERKNRDPADRGRVRKAQTRRHKMTALMIIKGYLLTD